MQLKQKFVLREIAGESILVPIMNKGDAFDGMISLNETSAFIWKKIEEGAEEQEIVAALLEEYDVEEEQAKTHVAKICSDLRKLGILE